jgi:hypothetical protein
MSAARVMLCYGSGRFWLTGHRFHTRARVESTFSQPGDHRSIAGTCTMYSKNAMPQLMVAAMYHGFNDKFLRWAYQAQTS